MTNAGKMWKDGIDELVASDGNSQYFLPCMQLTEIRTMVITANFSVAWMIEILFEFNIRELNFYIQVDMLKKRGAYSLG